MKCARVVKSSKGVSYLIRTACEHLNSERALRASRNEIARVEFDELYVADSAEAFQSRYRNYDRVEAAVGDACEARIDVAAERDNLESAIYARCLEAAPR